MEWFLPGPFEKQVMDKFLMGYKKRTEILLHNSKDMENTLVEINGLIELLKNESTDRGIFLLEEARRMFTSGRNTNTNSDTIARNEACLIQILEPQVPWLTLDYARDLSLGSPSFGIKFLNL